MATITPMESESKRCTKCHQVRLLAEFGKDNNTKDKLKYWCRACATEASRNYRITHVCKKPTRVRAQTARKRRKIPVIERFWSKVEVKNSNECWLWMGGKTQAGYGTLHDADTVIYAHRFIYQEVTGLRLRDDEVVRHLCHNRRCVNPSHLTHGSHADNIKDRDEAGRTACGERMNCNKLTAATVHEIIEKWESGGITQTKLANEYGVSVSTVNAVVNRRTWKHLHAIDNRVAP